MVKHYQNFTDETQCLGSKRNSNKNRKPTERGEMNQTIYGQCQICLAEQDIESMVMTRSSTAITGSVPICSNCDREFNADRYTTCSKCGSKKQVEERHSFGVYAGILCKDCCYSYRDHCGIDQPQGRRADLDEYEPYDEDY